MRPWRLVLLGLLAAVATVMVVFWSWIDAQRHAVVVLSTTSPTPVLSWMVRLVTDDPRAEETVIAGVPATLVRTGGGRRPAVVLIAGTVKGGRGNPSVLRVARGLARAGYLVVVPELPGATDGEIVEATVRAARDVAVETAHRSDARGGRVALAGAWSGAALALLAAEDNLLAPRVSVVAGVAPWTAAPNLLRLATTGFTLDGSDLKAYKADPVLALSAGRTLVAALRPSTTRSQLLQLLRGADPKDSDPLHLVRGLAFANLPPDAAAVVRLLANRHPKVFDGLYADLPDYLHAALERLSPLVGAAQLEARVELATAPKDRFVPPGESSALARASKHVRVTMTGAVANGLPDPSFGGAFSMDAYLVRVLRAAS